MNDNINQIPASHMTDNERLDEIATYLGRALRRLKARKDASHFEGTLRAYCDKRPQKP